MSLPTDPTPSPPPAGRVRLRRPREGRLIAGISVGLARHLGIDVVIVRVVLVVAAVLTSGLAVLAYLIAIPFIPVGEPDRAGRAGHLADGTEEPGEQRDPLFWVGLAILVLGVALLLGLGGGLLAAIAGGSGLVLPLVLIAFGFALWRSADRPSTAAAGPTPPSRGAAAAAWSSGPPPSSWGGGAVAAPGVAPRPPAVASGPPAQEPAMPVAPSTEPSPAAGPGTPVATDDPPRPDAGGTRSWGAIPWSDVTTPHGQPGDRGPGSPGPGGGAPGGPMGPGGADGGGGAGWSGSAPASWSPPPVPSRRRSLLGRITIGAALITLGVLWSLHLAGVVTVSPGQALAAVLLVVGIGTLVGSIVGRSPTLIVIGVLLVPVVLLATLGRPFGADVWWFGDDAPVGDQRATFATWDEVADRYELGAGRLQLDLSGLEPDGVDRELEVSVGAGEVIVRVPEELGLQLSVANGLGEIGLPGQGRTVGAGQERSWSRAGSEGTGTLRLDVEIGVGSVVVRDVSSSWSWEPDEPPVGESPEMPEPPPVTEPEPAPESQPEPAPEPEPAPAP